MHRKLLFSLISSLAVAATLNGCASVNYTSAENLRAPCIDAAKLKMADFAGNCLLLKEVSYEEYEHAVAAGDAWIEANNLDYKQIQSIRRGTVWVGMPADAAKLAWGIPSLVNKAGSFKHHEEWVYGNGNSLSIDYGKVSQIQN